MDEPYRYNFQDWPPYLEMVVQVKRQAEINTLEAYYSNYKIQVQCLWCVPEERLTLPTTIPFKRVLIGESGWADERSKDNVVALRRLVADALARPVAVHLASSLHTLFCA
jgi:hypothetical protein